MKMKMKMNEKKLLFYVDHGDSDNVKKILKDPNIDPNVNYDGLPLLHYFYETIAFDGTDDIGIGIVKELLAHPKIDPNIKDEDGKTALYKACWGNIDIVKLLVAHPEIKPNNWECHYYIDNDEITPFLKACEVERMDIVKLLLTHPEFNPTIQDKYGKTELDYCREAEAEHWHKEEFKIVNLLENFIKEKEQQTTEEFCLAMIQPTLSVLTMPRKRNVKELRRDELRLAPEIIKLIATYLQWTDISKKSCFEIRNIREMG